MKIVFKERKDIAWSCICNIFYNSFQKHECHSKNKENKVFRQITLTKVSMLQNLLKSLGHYSATFSSTARKKSMEISIIQLPSHFPHSQN